MGRHRKPSGSGTALMVVVLVAVVVFVVALTGAVNVLDLVP